MAALAALLAILLALASLGWSRAAALPAQGTTRLWPPLRRAGQPVAGLTGTSFAFVPQLLAIAEGELGYVEGSNNLTKYGTWAGDPNAAWCAEFICWCVHQADQQYGLSLLTWLIFAGLLIGRRVLGLRGRRAAMWTLLGFAMAVSILGVYLLRDLRLPTP